MKKIRWLLMVMVAVFNAACTYSSLGMSGRVIDKETKQPIENAIVIATWQGAVSQLVQTSNGCYHMEIVLTDKDGRYKINPWIRRVRSIVSGKEKYVNVYSEGYQVLSGGDDSDFELRKFKGTREEYFDWLVRVSGGGISYCEGDKYNRQKRYKLLVRTLDEMVKNSTGSEYEKDKIKYIESSINMSIVNNEKEIYMENGVFIRNKRKSDNYSHEELMKW